MLVLLPLVCYKQVAAPGDRATDGRLRVRASPPVLLPPLPPILARVLDRPSALLQLIE